jgi:hypothetical protein
MSIIIKNKIRASIYPYKDNQYYWEIYKDDIVIARSYKANTFIRCVGNLERFVKKYKILRDISQQ